MSDEPIGGISHSGTQRPAEGPVQTGDAQRKTTEKLGAHSVSSGSGAHGHEIENTSTLPQGILLGRKVMNASIGKAQANRALTLEDALIDNNKPIEFNSQDIVKSLEALQSAYDHPSDYKKYVQPKGLLGSLWNWVLQKIRVRPNSTQLIQDTLKETIHELGQLAARRRIGLDDTQIMNIAPIPGMDSPILNEVFIDAYIKELYSTCIPLLKELSTQNIDWKKFGEPNVAMPVWLFNQFGSMGLASDDVMRFMISKLTGSMGEATLAMVYFNGLFTSPNPAAKTAIPLYYSHFGATTFKMPANPNADILQTILDMQALHGVSDEVPEEFPALYHAYPHFVEEVTNTLLQYIQSHPEDSRIDGLIRDLDKAYRGFDPDTKTGQRIVAILNDFAGQLSTERSSKFKKAFPVEGVFPTQNKE